MMNLIGRTRFRFIRMIGLAIGKAMITERKIAISF